MSSASQERDALEATISGTLGRELSTWTVLFHTVAAERMGLGGTDHKALTLIDQHGPMTAGELATLTGLTTGAITNVIDRLERAGYVERTKDARDRRKVVVVARPSPNRDAAFAGIFGSLAQHMRAICARYSDAELVAIQDFMTASIGVFQQEIARLRAEAAAGDQADTHV
jgi:DNA-binding MarR family transcriptional regulator